MPPPPTMSFSLSLSLSPPKEAMQLILSPTCKSLRLQAQPFYPLDQVEKQAPKEGKQPPAGKPSPQKMTGPWSGSQDVCLRILYFIVFIFLLIFIIMIIILIINIIIYCNKYIIVYCYSTHIHSQLSSLHLLARGPTPHPALATATRKGLSTTAVMP